MAPRIALIHATKVAIDPIIESFSTLWPEAKTTNLLEDSLSRDLAAAKELTPSMHERFCELTTYARRTGADAVLFTCSAFGPCIETARRVVDIPVLKPNEAMIDEALALGRRLALVATFEPSLPSMKAEIEDEEARRGIALDLSVHLAAAALPALLAGDGAKHDALIADAVKGIEGKIDAVLLAQFSMARAQNAVSAVTGARILTSPASAVNRLRRELKG